MQTKTMTVIGHVHSNLEIKNASDGSQYATSLIAIDCGNTKLEHIALVFANDMITFAVKHIAKNIKAAITGIPVVHAYINQYGQAVASQKIYVDNVKLLTNNEDLSEITQVNLPIVGVSVNNTQMQVLDANISDLFKGFVLQNSTIKLINHLYSTHGIVHVKALAKDTMERADNYDSYIFKMLSSSAEPKWYALNQAKFMHELNTQDELLEIKQQVKSQYDSLVDEYNQYCSNADNLQELTQKLHIMIDKRIDYYTNNPQKLVVQVIGLEQYIINTTNKFQKYLTSDYLFFVWLKFNQKQTDTIQNNKLYMDFYSEFNIYL